MKAFFHYRALILKPLDSFLSLFLILDVTISELSFVIHCSIFPFFGFLINFFKMKQR